MPCVLVVLALLTPRVTVLLLWFLSPALRGVFDTLLWPIIGFIFLPTTLLWYVAVQLWFAGQWTLMPILGLVVALAIDLSPASGKKR
jgi:hypothetical protein